MNLRPCVSTLFGLSLVITFMVCASCNQDALVKRSQMDTSKSSAQRAPLNSSAGAVAGYPPLVLSIEPWDPPVDIGPDGQLLYSASHICVNWFSVAFVAGFMDEIAAGGMPW